MIPTPFIFGPAHAAGAPRHPGHILQRLLAAPVFSAVCLLIFLLLLAMPAAQAQAPQPVTDFVPDTDIFFDEDRAAWMRYTTVPGISYTLERTLDQQTWTAVPEGSVYGTGPDMEIMVKHPSVIVPGDPLPPPPHPVYRYFIAVLGNGQAHVTCLPSMGTGVHYAMISWPFAQHAFPGIGVYGALIEPKAGYPSVPNVPYAVTFDAWALAPNLAQLPTTANPTAAQQMRMTRLLDAIPWIEHDMTVNPPLVATGPPQPAAAITAADRSYFRVRVQFLDTDTDGLSDHVELADGTSPFVSDSDGDGLSDAVEKTNGTSGSVYNIPDLTLESSSRTLVIEDSGSAPAGAETLSVKVNGGVLPLSNLPSGLRWAVIPEAQGHSGELNSNVAVPHFVLQMDGLLATAQREAGGWSKWEPFSGADMATYSNVRHYVPLATSPPTQHRQTHKIVLTQYRYRIHASHSMAHAWPAVLQVKAASRENALGGTSGLGWQLATNVLPAGAGANKHVRLTLPPGQTVSPEVVFSFPFTENFFNREFRTGILRPRVAVTPGDVDAETLSPTGLFASISALDADTDGVVLPAELALGSSTTTWNSRDDAVPDSHQPVEGLNGDNLFPEIRERVMDWDRAPYAAYPKPKETFLATASWSGPPETDKKDSLVTDPDDLGAELTTDWQWPTSPLSDQAPAGVLQSTATLDSLGSGNALCHHAIVTHRQVRLRRYPYVGKPERSLDYLKVTERRINSGTPTLTVEPVVLTFPAGQQYTGEQELMPSLVAKKADLAQPRKEVQKVALTKIKIQVKEKNQEDQVIARRYTTADKLRVAKLSTHRDNAGKVHVPLQQQPGPGMLDPAEDKDSFFVEVDQKELRGGTARVRVTTQCTEAGFTQYCDAASDGEKNILEFYDAPGSESKIRTNWMALTSDVTDDTWPVNGIADDAKGDVTRRVALGGTVHFDFYSAPGADPVRISLPVKVEKTIAVKAAILADAEITVGTLTRKVNEDDVKKDIERCNERYAQAGVRIQLQSTTEVQAPAGGSSVDPPLKDKLQLTSVQNLAQLVLAQLTQQGVPRQTANQPVVIYCRKINTLFANLTVGGFGLFPRGVPNHEPEWNLVFVQPVRDDFLVAHEMGHLLTDSGHWSENGYFDSLAGGTPPEGMSLAAASNIMSNLMANSANWKDSNLDSLLPGTVQTGPPAKRLTSSQVKLMKNFQ